MLKTYRVVFTSEFTLQAENRQDARDKAINMFSADGASGDWEITYVGQEIPVEGNPNILYEELDVTDNSVKD